MTKAETGRLLDLLMAWYPQAKNLRGDPRTVLAAWFVALEPYDYEIIRQTAVQWYRGPNGKYCPDARELIPATRKTEYTPNEYIRALSYLHLRVGREDYPAYIDALESLQSKDEDIQNEINWAKKKMAGEEDVA